MTTRNTDSCQGDGGKPPPQHDTPAPTDQQRSRGGNKVYKSGALFLSSRGIGWTSWKKRWFILTRTSLVFFRNDPSAIPQKGSEVNLTLGGIDLNSSGSVVVKADKKLLTVLFPDGRDGRAFTLKAETSEDLYEWKEALEEALSNAPSAALVMGQNGIFRNSQTDAADGSSDHCNLKDRQPVKSFVIGRPILLALEDIDGAPSFLEKALRFLEEYGVKVEGILRQAADVDDVERRVREYEQGKGEFSPEEDPHVIADCVKYFLRELPSSPVPASCCNALLEACRTDRGMRVTAMRTAICETFPEPNRRLLQRILMMMQTVASHKAETRMSTSAVAACMAPLLLRPLLAGDCELENHFDMVGDGSVQLLQAAAAANHAQAIVITLLEEYDSLFGEGSVSPELYSDSEESGSETEELSDDDETFEDDGDDDDATDCSNTDVEEDVERASSGTNDETGDNDLYDHKGSEGSKSPELYHDVEANQKVPSYPPQSVLSEHNNVEGGENFPNQTNNVSAVHANYSGELLGDDLTESSRRPVSADKNASTCKDKTTTVSNGHRRSSRAHTFWGRTPAKKNLSMESIDISSEDESEIQKLEVTKSNLQNRIAAEAKGNAALLENLEKRKNALHERRLALEQDVAKLQEQLQKERELRTVLEAGLEMSQGTLPVLTTVDEKVKAELEEIAQAEADVINLKQKADDLGAQLNQQREQTCCSLRDSSNDTQQTPHQGKQKDKQKDSEATATSRIFEKSTRSKGLPSLPNKHSPQNQQSESARNSNSAGPPATSSSVETGIGRPATTTTNYKKFGTRNEGGSSTSSALSKLTNRLNFLKERRTQITTEIQKHERGRGHESSPDAQSSSEKVKGSESNQDKWAATENSSVQNLGKNNRPNTLSLQNLDKGRRPEGLPSPNLDRGTSESLISPNLDRGKSESFPNTDKGRSVVPPRTFSR